MERTKRKNGDTGTPISTHQHTDASRLNIPEATQAKSDVPKTRKPTYRYSPHLSPELRFDTSGAWNHVQGLIEKAIAGEKLTLDEATILRAATKQGAQPWLEWASKREQEAKGKFAVDDVVLHVHERVSAKAIIAAVHRDEREIEDLFARPQLHREQALQYYRHNVDWANRLILGDSLQVMSSLANRENLAGKVQMIYIDPPYGIKFSSNWQNEVKERSVGDKEVDLTREPEVIKAYRDTWELGVHSYLAYLKQRLSVGHTLLADTGSMFVQISDENLHYVRTLMDEVFEPENSCGIISFVKTGGIKQTLLADRCDYLLWYAKNVKKMTFIRQFLDKEGTNEGTATYTWLDLPGGERRGMTAAEKSGESDVPGGAKLYRAGNITTQGNPVVPFEWQGKTYRQPWKTTPEGLRRMGEAGRLHVAANSLAQVAYLDDFRVSEVTKLWTDTFLGSFAEPKVFVVQTSTKTVQRCMLMTTKPGDLVLDPTCGSGTTAFVAEQWGRRWITADSSRIALSIARQRLLTACFESYKTKDPSGGVDPTAPQNPAHGFCYKTVPHITLKSIAQNQNLDPIIAKHAPNLATALAKVNQCLSLTASSLRPALVAKLKAKVSAEGARAITGADLRRWLLPGTDPGLLTFGTASQRAKWKEAVPVGPGWQEWEVPFDTDPDWPRDLQESLTACREAWRAKMHEVNACISASAEQEELVAQPEIVRGIIRVSGPFSVEGVRPEELALGEDGKVFDPTTDEFDDLGSTNADGYIDLLIGLLKKDGVTFLGNRRAEFASLEKEAGRSFHARGVWKGRENDGPSVAVFFGPQYGPINAPMTVEAIEAARGLKEVTDLVIAGFSFDAAAQQKAKEMDTPAMRVHLAHIRPDISPGMQGLLKETPNSQLFTVFGQPDIAVLPAGDGEYKVEMNGVCIYNPLTGEISDSSNTKVAAWFLDTDYDGRCFCFSQAFFPDKSAWEKIAKALGSSVPEGAFQAFTTSWPFRPGKHNRIAVKVIDPRGNEVMAIKTLTT